MADWIKAQGWGIQACAVRDVGLRDASDPLIFRAAPLVRNVSGCRRTIGATRVQGLLGGKPGGIPPWLQLSVLAWVWRGSGEGNLQVVDAQDDVIEISIHWSA